MNKDTEEFLEALNKQNQAIADREAEKEKAKEIAKPPPDLVRLQREQERREKWGQLRAREQPNKRPHRVRRLFPFSNPS